MLKTLTKRLTVLFIAAHLTCIVVWSIPSDALWWKRLKQVIEPTMLFTGLWQGWDMFSPEPLSINARLTAELTLKDGTMQEWKFPEVASMGPVDAFYGERWRKWAIDRVRLDENAKVWPDTARYVLRHASINAENPPTELKLVRHWRTIVAPANSWLKLGDENTTTENHYTYYTYKVSEKDLQR